MASPGMVRPLGGWQRANVLAAAEYMRQRLRDEPDDARVRVIYEGLLDLLDPSRRAVRHQRELADAAKAAHAIREQRKGRERRAGADRRTTPGTAPGNIERRRAERRSGRDRRNR